MPGTDAPKRTVLLSSVHPVFKLKTPNQTATAKRIKSKYHYIINMSIRVPAKSSLILVSLSVTVSITSTQARSLWNICIISVQ